MTKKHFIALADAIRDHNRYGAPLAGFNQHHLETLSKFCAGQNRNFNASRWLGYIKGECGPNGGAIKNSPSHESGDHCPDCFNAGYDSGVISEKAARKVL